MEEADWRRLYINEWPQPHCVSNLPKTDKEFVLSAARRTKADVIWDDRPDSRMGPEFGDTPEILAQYGSIWSTGDDLSDFWDAFHRAKGEALARKQPRRFFY